MPSLRLPVIGRTLLRTNDYLSENLASFSVSVQWSLVQHGLLAEILLSKGKLHINLVQPSSEKLQVDRSDRKPQNY